MPTQEAQQAEIESVSATQRFFYRLHSRLEVIRPLQSDYIPFVTGKQLVDVCNSVKLTALFHITHIDNLAGILTKGLLCHNRADPSCNISNPDIQEHRANKFVSSNNSLTLHDYVPLFIAPRPPMLSALRDLQPDLVYLHITPAVLLRSSIAITDGNARSRATQFYSEFDALTNLDWNLLRAQYWGDEGNPEQHREKKRRRSAEVLVPEFIPRAYIDRVSTLTLTTKEKAVQQVRTSGAEIPVDILPDLFYPT